MFKGIATVAFATAVSALGVSFSTQASANPLGPKQITATYTGVVDPLIGIDTLGEFGPMGSDLGGAPFTATFTINERNPNQGGFPPTQSAYVGLASADLKINGRDV